MNRTPLILTALTSLVLSACDGQVVTAQPHPAVTLLAGVNGHLLSCKNLIAKGSVSSKDALELGPLFDGFANDQTSTAGAPPGVPGELAQVQSELSACTGELYVRAGIHRERANNSFKPKPLRGSA